MPSKPVYDAVLRKHISLKSLRVLRLCPVDTFFDARSSGLHGSTLASLHKKGYLNCEATKDGLGFEYYLNNHGHRLRRMHISDFDDHLPPLKPQHDPCTR